MLFRSATHLVADLIAERISPTELTEASLNQISLLNPAVNAIVTLNQHAMQDAENLENARASGNPPGPLYGLPVGIKEVTPVAGVRTTFGSSLFSDHIPEKDAVIVNRLRKAGAIIIGKTNCPEFAAGANTWNDVFGYTRNPWNLALSAGGSTGGGAAALATGMIALAEGTDLGGSLRVPAAFCGLIGMRTSPGLIPTSPTPYLWDAFHIEGPMARTVEDLALMLQAVSGKSDASPLHQPTAGRDFLAAVENANLKGQRVAYCCDIAGIGIDDEIEKVCHRAAMEMRQTGIQVDEIDMDLSFMRQPFQILRGYWFVSRFYEFLDRIDEFGINVRNNLKAGLKITMTDLAQAEQARSRAWLLLKDFFEKYDLLLTPCVAVPPFPVEQNYPDTIGGREMETYIDWIAPTFVLSFLDLPVLSAPAGLDTNRLPVGMQIVGPPMGEERVLAFARFFQEANDIGMPELAGRQTLDGKSSSRNQTYK